MCVTPSGAIRPRQRGRERLKETAKLGFTQAIVPSANHPKQKIAGVTVLGVQQLDEAVRGSGQAEALASVCNGRSICANFTRLAGSGCFSAPGNRGRS